MNLSEEHKSRLLDYTRSIISDYLEVQVEFAGRDSFPGDLNINCGVFVSLYVEDRLRGCIGTFSEEHSLEENLRRMAISAATEDHRFKSVLPEEAASMHIEISVLSPRLEVRNYQEVIPGKHGIYMKKGNRTGTLLPQVAVKQNWDLEQFLGHCARDKAGIGWNGWREAELYSYEAIIFKS